MNKVDFSDINKFITSIGLLIVILALFMPWFVNSYFDVLTIEHDTLHKLTVVGRNTIIDQQHFINHVNHCLKCIMFLLIIIGSLLMIFGLIRWNVRQKVLNGIQDEEWRLKKQEGISDSEKQESVKTELEEQESDNDLTEHTETSFKNVSQSTINKYLEIEDLIYLKLANAYNVNYQTKQNIRINRQEFDIILESKEIVKRPDLVIEIKYFKRKVSESQYQIVVRRFLLAISEYEQAMQRKGTTPVLIFIYDTKEILDFNKPLAPKLIEFANNYGVKNFRLIEIVEDDLKSIAPEKLISN